MTSPRSQRSERARTTRGFTLFELLLTISLVAALAGGVAIATNGFKSENDLRLTSTIVENGIRSAKLYARAGRHDDSWGIKILPTEAVVFRGATYASRTEESDEIIPFPSSMDISGSDEIVFSASSGLPDTVGTIRIENTSGEINLSVSELGIIVP